MNMYDGGICIEAPYLSFIPYHSSTPTSETRENVFAANRESRKSTYAPPDR